MISFSEFICKKRLFEQFNYSEAVNSHGTSWQQTAKIVLNADNGRNEHNSLKIALVTPLKFKDQSFGATYKHGFNL